MSIEEDNSKQSYRQILKSSSIIGGAQCISYILALVKIKFVAVLLGPSGVGLIGIYTSITGLIGTIAGMGIETSGVRAVAEAQNKSDEKEISRTIAALRRICWITGLLGWSITAVLSYQISIWAFDSPEKTYAIILLGGTILIGTLTGVRNALIQGTRRIADIARLNVLSSVSGTVVAVSLYAWIGERGIVAVLLLTGFINLGFSSWFASRINTTTVSQSWTETLRYSKRIIGLGMAFMYGALLAAFVDLVIRLNIVQNLGLEVNGIFQAALNISGIFSAFILAAMAADFYPSITALAHDDDQVNRLVNDQTEIGILLALPGLLGTLLFATWAITIFYSEKFLQGADLLQWFVFGAFGQIIAFPVAYIQRAKSATRWIYIWQSCSSISYLIFALILLPVFNILGIAFAYVISVTFQYIVAMFIANNLSKFSLSKKNYQLILISLALIIISFFIKQIQDINIKTFCSVLILSVSFVFSGNGIVKRFRIK